MSTARMPKLDWLSDGLAELLYGFAHLVMGGLPALLWLADRRAGLVALVLLWSSYVALLFHDYDIILRLKARFHGATTPDGNSLVTTFRNRTVAAFLLSFNLMLLLRTAWAPFIVMSVAGLMLYRANRNQTHRYSVRSVVLLGLSGFPFCWARLDTPQRMMLPFVLGGAWLVARGLFAFRRYSRTLPPGEGVPQP